MRMSTAEKQIYINIDTDKPNPKQLLLGDSRAIRFRDDRLADVSIL